MEVFSLLPGGQACRSTQGPPCYNKLLAAFNGRARDRCAWPLVSQETANASMAIVSGQKMGPLERCEMNAQIMAPAITNPQARNMRLRTTFSAGFFFPRGTELRRN